MTELNLSQRPVQDEISTLRERFWSKVAVHAEAGKCWEWQAARDKDGYGRCSIKRQTIAAHRISWMLTYGTMPTQIIRHTCDNPPCVNPAHLLQGSHADNMSDAADRRRFPLGENHYKAKLTDAKVVEIRRLLSQGVKRKVVADRYGVYLSVIDKVRSKEIWAHVKD